jgi:hypothetical protein
LTFKGKLLIIKSDLFGKEDLLSSGNFMTNQFLLTPAAGKRLIAKSFLNLPPIQKALKDNVVVIIAGTTNGYLAEEILGRIGQSSEFDKKRFFRGITLPPKSKITGEGRMPDESRFPGDVIIEKGKWLKGKTIFDVADGLQQGDVIVKGANALQWPAKQAAIYIGHPKAGTINAALQAVLGRRVRLYIPVGLEKRVYGDLNQIALKLNSTDSSGPRLLPVCGEVITEIEAIAVLTGAQAELVAAGGIAGAEGSIRLAVTGDETQLDSTKILIKSIADEPSFEF